LLYSGGADERKNLLGLIQAYAALPSITRKEYQLVFAGKMPQGEIAHLKEQAHLAGLLPEELVFTGYVSDDELIQFYNLCKLFVFPSWHEGFGLPALEAMACGAPVIGSNTTSLPEVIGMVDALFDPLDVSAITRKIQQSLVDEAFRLRLQAHGRLQIKRFSWDATAKRAIAAWESIPKREVNTYLDDSLAEQRLYKSLAIRASAQAESTLVSLSSRLARNQQAGIKRQLFLDISELSQRDAATGVQRVVRSYLYWLLQSAPEDFRVEPVYATRDTGYRYARAYTQSFLGLAENHVADNPITWQRGDVFFGLDMQHHVQLTQHLFYRQLQREGVTVKFLVHDLLPIQLADFFHGEDAKHLHEQWLTMIAATDGAICVSKATADAFQLWMKDNAVSPAPNFQTSWVHNGADIEISALPLVTRPDAQIILAAIRSRPGFLCVATLEPRKGQRQILDAIEQLWAQGVQANLILVGQQGWKIEALAHRIHHHPEIGHRLFWLQGISDQFLKKIYEACTCLIAASLNEGFGLPLIEAAKHGTPIIARDIPIFREVAGDFAHYFAGESPSDLAEAVQAWLVLYRNNRHPKSEGMPFSTWQQSSTKLKTALIEHNYQRRQLLVDISELAQRDAKSGIQRVVRSILREWLVNPPKGYRVEPVYANIDQHYFYARQFSAKVMGSLEETLYDDPIDYAPGDIFFGLDLQPQVQIAQRNFYQELRQQGVRVEFLLHDLLCIQMPQCFVPGSGEGFSRWLDVVAENDGAICVSKTVADELRQWVADNTPPRERPFRIDWSHNGADIKNSIPSSGIPPDANTVLQQICSRLSFLMVGTLEPRKGHEEVLDTFDQLWREGQDVNLVIVGKRGWLVDALVDRLKIHPELRRRLFWLEGISDQYLESVYVASDCLIAASYGEGFGLPLIEAAQHKLPIIARDISVFREVAGEYAYYFGQSKSNTLSRAVKDWLGLRKSNKHPSSEGLQWLSWSISARNLARLLCSSD
jgi:glycosyltransferase involved in cell wall biosynthesis